MSSSGIFLVCDSRQHYGELKAGRDWEKSMIIWTFLMYTTEVLSATIGICHNLTALHICNYKYTLSQHFTLFYEFLFKRKKDNLNKTSTQTI